MKTSSRDTDLEADDDGKMIISSLSHGSFGGLMAERAAGVPPTIPHVMIIDEINRANLPKVFGELLFLLGVPQRERAQTLYRRPDDPFELPREPLVHRDHEHRRPLHRPCGCGPASPVSLHPVLSEPQADSGAVGSMAQGRTMNLRG